MYTLAVRRSFIARHYLIGADWGPENFPNSHNYVLELQLEGRELDHHGFLVDITDIEKHLDELADYYREKMLNDLPEFDGLNPSLENFVRILHTDLIDGIKAPNIKIVKVILWENENAWAAFSMNT
jgi:6-pyruvoyltetrahydropterin/6-carboxytetrahydropterin synthase